MRATGGLALGAISTRSRCFSSANANASRPDIIPICSFSGPTTRSSRARISSLMRGVSLLIAFTSKRIKKRMAYTIRIEFSILTSYFMVLGEWRMASAS